MDTQSLRPGSRVTERIRGAHLSEERLLAAERAEITLHYVHGGPAEDVCDILHLARESVGVPPAPHKAVGSPRSCCFASYIS